ncbi:hypothetical protein [Winogradskya humida]|uniref:Uncharacterized protein n=1 Tax=Winogradskya humida TaxID=113566 RepID=A0ABQ4A787_9ACTN|nr:hypothetical protein [Actinoplanes humidus]GIE26699.1 hypothetical protein Ahu01nite_098010 [Actinoplanes humidus]
MTDQLVRWLVRDAPSVRVGRGLELIDRDLQVLDEITELEGGTIRRDSYAVLHATAELDIARELAWGRGIVRPYLTLASGNIRGVFRLGAYFLNTPRRSLGRRPGLYRVQGYDYLHGLTARIGEAYAVPAGAPVLEHIIGILQGLGYTQYVVDQGAADRVVPTPGKAWALIDDPTWLGVINDLLGSIGYQGIWTDWDGRLRIEQYHRPIDRPAEWVYDTLPDTSMLLPDREIEADFFDAPNAWTFYRSNMPDDAQPTPGNGLYRYVNQTVGPTSVEARDRVIPAPSVGLDVDSQDALVAAAQSQIDADMAITTTVTAPTGLNPLHWHMDRVDVTDPEIGPPFHALVSAWELPLAGRSMQQTWTMIQ